MLHMGSRVKNVKNVLGDNTYEQIMTKTKYLESKTTITVELNKQDLGHVQELVSEQGKTYLQDTT